jgi:hypothetical protein
MILFFFFFEVNPSTSLGVDPEQHLFTLPFKAGLGAAERVNPCDHFGGSEIREL